MQAPLHESDLKSPRRTLWAGGIICWVAAVSVLTNTILWRTASVVPQMPATEMGNDNHELFDALDEVFAVAAHKGLQWSEKDVDALVHRAYQPAYDAIPAFADRHYSLLGEWSELGLLLSGKLASSFKDELLHGMEKRLDGVSSELTRTFRTEFEEALAHRLPALGKEPQLPRQIWDTVSSDLSLRLPASLGASAVIGVSVGRIITVQVLENLGRSTAASIATRATAWLGLSKGGSVLGGASIGAAACSWTGIGAVPCGIIGGLAVAVGSEAVAIEIQEFFFREDFEESLRRALHASEERTKDDFRLMLHYAIIALDSHRVCYAETTAAEWERRPAPVCRSTT